MRFKFPNPSEEAGIEDIVSSLKTNGMVVVTDVLDKDTVAKMMSAIEPAYRTKMPQSEADPEADRHDVYGVTGLLGVDKIYAEALLLNPMYLAVADRILKPHCHNYRVQVSSAARIVKGGENQYLHREMDIYRPFIPYDPVQAEYILFSMWAGTDFTIENGATRMVPGSHLWDEQRKAREDEVVQATMPSGSVAMWLGTTLHGGAVNTTDDPRQGFICALGVDWLTPEENQFMAVPPEFARTLPERAQRLVGYQYAPMYGWVRGITTENLLDVDTSVLGYQRAGLFVS